MSCINVCTLRPFENICGALCETNDVNSYIIDETKITYSLQLQCTRSTRRAMQILRLTTIVVSLRVTYPRSEHVALLDTKTLLSKYSCVFTYTSFVY